MVGNRVNFRIFGRYEQGQDERNIPKYRVKRLSKNRVHVKVQKNRVFKSKNHPLNFKNNEIIAPLD